MLHCIHTMLHQRLRKTNQRIYMIRETILSLTENVIFDVFLKYDLLLSSAGFWNKFRNSIFELKTIRCGFLHLIDSSWYASFPHKQWVLLIIMILTLNDNKCILKTFQNFLLNKTEISVRVPEFSEK